MLGTLRRLVERAVGAGDDPDGAGAQSVGPAGRAPGDAETHARIDAARERLRESIPPPEDDDDLD